MRRRTITAADRPQFRRDVRELLEKTNAEVGEIDSDVTIVCTKAASFDPATNVLWELEANKSAARPDVICFACKAPLAMSNDAYGRYRALDKKPRAVCAECVLTALE